MNSNLYLSQQERIARIGQLLSKGITLMLLREAAEKRSTESQQPSNSKHGYGATAQNGRVPLELAIADDGERAIIEYLKRVLAASPRDIQSCLDLSKATAFRKLDRLVKANLVARTGRTTAIRYRVISARTRDVPEVA